MKRIVHIAFAGLVSVMVTLVGVGSYPLAWAGTLSCCCGDHAADDACGCPTCPAAEASDDVDEEVQETRLRSCGGATLFAPGQVIKLVSAADVALVLGAPSVRAPHHFENAALPRPPTARPDAPDS